MKELKLINKYLMHTVKNFTETFAWFGRYKKIMNVLPKQKFKLHRLG